MLFTVIKNKPYLLCGDGVMQVTVNENDEVNAVGKKKVKVDKGSLYVLKKTKAPAMLIECCFVDDKDDVHLYDYQSMASAIVYGITGQEYVEKVDHISDSEAEASGSETATGDAKAVYRVQVD